MQLTSQIPPKTQFLTPRSKPGTVGTHHQPTFKGLNLNLPPNATSQFTRDILGVWVPKIPLTRSKTQFFEDAFLENVENVAFYFAVPIAAPVFAVILRKMHGLKDVTTKEVGSAWSELPKDALKKGGSLVGAKIGTVVAVLSLAAGWEYMVQHAKNVITAKQFDTKNFAAVAGLEHNKATAQDGEMDPVDKAKRRAWQVGSAMLAGFGVAAALPFLVRKSPAVEAMAKQVLTYLHFDSNEKKGILFDLTKPMLAMLAGIGAVSYIDAARDWLERKETAMRLCLVIPYMLFGKELAGNLLAKWMETSKVEVEEGRKIVMKPIPDALAKYYAGSGKQFSFLKSGSLWEQFKKPGSLLNLDKVKGSLAEELAEHKVPAKLQEAVFKVHSHIGVGSYLLSAALCGVAINWLAYRQTKHRFELQQQQLKARQQQQGSPFTTNSGFSGHAPQPPQSPFAYGQPYQAQRGTAGFTRPAVAFQSQQPNGYAWPVDPRYQTR